MFNKWYLLFSYYAGILLRKEDLKPREHTFNDKHTRGQEWDRNRKINWKITAETFTSTSVKELNNLKGPFAMKWWHIILYCFIYFFHELIRNEVSQKAKPFSTHKLKSGELSRRHMWDYFIICDSKILETTGRIIHRTKGKWNVVFLCNETCRTVKTNKLITLTNMMTLPT